MRVFRLAKLAKIFRVVRVMKVFSELRKMAASLAGSFSALFWCFVMLFLILYVFGLVIVQGLTIYLLEQKKVLGEEIFSQENQDLVAQFGSMERTMYTLYKTSVGGEAW